MSSTTPCMCRKGSASPGIAASHCVVPLGTSMMNHSTMARGEQDREDAAIRLLGGTLGAEMTGLRMEPGDPAIAERLTAGGTVVSPGDTAAFVASIENQKAVAAQTAKVLDLKMLCANPDFEVMKGTTRLVCAGALALKYEQLGGVVRYHGKPYPSIYALCLGRLAIADRRRVLAVGDALRTDIAGAASAGIDSAFIPGGIHGPQLGISMGELPEPARLARLYGDSDTRPSLTLAAFRWSGQ